MSAAVLLDANVLVALVHAAHVHHATVQRWISGRRSRRWASCAVTQLAFVRLAAMPQIGGPDATPARALRLLQAMTGDARHEFWREAPSPLEIDALASPALVGHRQVTDAWLLGLAAGRDASLATLDRGLRSYAAAGGLEPHVEWIGPEAYEPAAPSHAARPAKKRAR